MQEDLSFAERSLCLYKYQYQYNALYRDFVNIVRYNGYVPTDVRDIPFMPITLFKSNVIKTGDWEEEQIFLSSGTTLGTRSKHYVRSLQMYRQNTERIWRDQFGDLSKYEFVSLLPHYHDNPSSSLVCMVEHFMLEGAARRTQYFLDDLDLLYDKIERYRGEGRTLVLFGVSFALLSYADQYHHTDLDDVIVIETGGMKRYRKELTRQELHGRLQEAFGGARILSEYGMTECLSQLYTNDQKRFVAHPQMDILIGDPTDPGALVNMGRKGRVLIIDLGNLDTVSFIATDDLGVKHEDGTIEILGRIDNSDLRGCNYLL